MNDTVKPVSVNLNYLQHLISNPEYEIAVMLPTRGRTEALKTSLLSLVDTARDLDRINFMLAFDDDDVDTVNWFKENLDPILHERGINCTSYTFPRMGYARLNEYLNQLANFASADWFMFWNDDAIMHTTGWDDKIVEHTGKFRCLRMPTHNSHPYAIFPIVPKEWYMLFGYLSAHQITDAWCSQISYLVDIMVNIDVDVTHDRHDITGNNKDETFDNRVMFEGNHNDPKDFNYESWRLRRFRDAAKIAWYLKTQGEDITWFQNVMIGKQDPWEKMTGPEFDPNKQLKVFK